MNESDWSLQWLTRKHKRALYEALEKIKSELMLLGFLSLLLTVGQGPISDICISKAVGATWHPCSKKEEIDDDKDKSSSSDGGDRRRLLSVASGGARRVLAAAGKDKCAAKVHWIFLPAFYKICQVGMHVCIKKTDIYNLLCYLLDRESR